MSTSRKLAYNVHVVNEDGVLQVFGPDDDVPAWAEKQITNPSAWADGSSVEDEAGDPGDATPVPYSEWKKADLAAEVDRRNEGREDDAQIEVAAPGNKAELVAALEADDAE